MLPSDRVTSATMLVQVLARALILNWTAQPWWSMFLQNVSDMPLKETILARVILGHVTRYVT